MDYKIDYKEKYLKYRQKYLNLKNQIGGAKELYLPCEIITISNKLAWGIQSIKDKFCEKNRIYEDFFSPIMGSQEFMQDTSIVFKDNRNIDRRYKSNIKNDSDLGGNFISSPPNKNDGKIFCFKGISEITRTYINSNICQELVELDCSFTINNERHIDECMCFMPYGINNYKIWIYTIRNISYYYNYFKDINIETFSISDTCTLFEYLERYKIDNLPIYNSDTMSLLMFQQKNQRFNIICTDIENFKSHKCKFEEKKEAYNRSINKILQTSIDIEKKIQLDIYFNPLSHDLEYIKDPIEIKKKLCEEQKSNLNIISNKLFGKSYDKCIDKFIEFPIDLKVSINPINKSINYTITNIPISNRIIYETINKCYIFFSIDDIIDSDIQKILDIESLSIKSCIDSNKDIIIECINTKEYDAYGKGETKTGGNLHCLIKNIY